MAAAMDMPLQAQTQRAVDGNMPTTCKPQAKLCDMQGMAARKAAKVGNVHMHACYDMSQQTERA